MEVVHYKEGTIWNGASLLLFRISFLTVQINSHCFENPFQFISQFYDQFYFLTCPRDAESNVGLCRSSYLIYWWPSNLFWVLTNIGHYVHAKSGRAFDLWRQLRWLTSFPAKERVWLDLKRCIRHKIYFLPVTRWCNLSQLRKLLSTIRAFETTHSQKTIATFTHMLMYLTNVIMNE